QYHHQHNTHPLKHPVTAAASSLVATSSSAANSSSPVTPQQQRHHVHAATTRPSTASPAPSSSSSSSPLPPHMRHIIAQHPHQQPQQQQPQQPDTQLLDDSLSLEAEQPAATPPFRTMSPLFQQRQRARSLSCSPSKAHNESDIILLQNEKFKERFPKACAQME